MPGPALYIQAHSKGPKIPYGLLAKCKAGGDSTLRAMSQRLGTACPALLLPTPESEPLNGHRYKVGVSVAKPNNSKKTIIQMQYRRAKIKGGTYFFTVNLADRSSSVLTEKIDLLRSVMKNVRQRHPFQIDAMVVLPEHLHTVWTLPPEDDNYPLRWMLIKAGFSRACKQTERVRASRQRKGERGIWQRRYWEHMIRDDADFAKHMNYIHYNPVKHGHAKRPVDWPYSSIHRYIREDVLPRDWAGGHGVDEMSAGEVK